MQSSGGAHTGSYGPNATTSAASDTASEPAAPEAPASSEADRVTSSASTDASAAVVTPEIAAVAATPAPVDISTPQSTAPQHDSATEENTTPILKPTTIGVGSEAVVSPGEFDALGPTTLISTTTGALDPANTQLFTASAVEDTTITGSPMVAAFSAEQDSFAAAPLAAPQDPLQALAAVPAAVVDIAGGFIAALLSPFLAPGPVAPAQPPLTLFAVLDWVRREIARTFFNRSPNAVAEQYTTSEGDDSRATC